MQTSIVLTLTGPDRIGIVEDVTAALLELGGNVENSRMARLGGEFAILMLVTLPQEDAASVSAALTHLTDAGYKLTASPTQETPEAAHPGWLPFSIDVEGADHEGIIHEIARRLSRLGINIESMETGTSRAPLTGTQLFTMTALVSVPPDVADGGWIAEVVEAGRQAGVDVRVGAEER